MKDLHLLSNSTAELTFGWNVSEGWVDHYDLRLYSQDNVLQEHKKVGAKERSCDFPHLLPGTLYKLVVISKSRGLSSETSIWARTGERLSNHSGNVHIKHQNEGKNVVLHELRGFLHTLVSRKEKERWNYGYWL